MFDIRNSFDITKVRTPYFEQFRKHKVLELFNYFDINIYFRLCVVQLYSLMAILLLLIKAFNAFSIFIAIDLEWGIIKVLNALFIVEPEETKHILYNMEH